MAEKQTVSFEEFIAKVPDAPSSSFPHAEPEEAEAPPKDESAAPSPARDEKGKFSKREDKAPEPPAGDPQPEAEKSAKTPSSGDPRDAILAALRAGDLDVLADLTDEDPAKFDEKTVKWAKQKQYETRLRVERDQIATKAEAIVQRWSPVSQLAEAVANGDAARLPELVELLTGQDYDGLIMKAARARGANDPQVPVLKKQIADRDAELEKTRAARAEAADRAFYETLRDEVPADSLVRQIDGWEKRVADTLREAFDPGLGESRFSVAQAVTRVVRKEREEYERRAKVFGAETPAKPKKEKAPAVERASGATAAKVRKMTRDEWLAARSNG